MKKNVTHVWGASPEIDRGYDFRVKIEICKD